ncbi:TPA: dihydroorotate dehydrogenase [Candidatus Marinimicrobia bacterium]|nr:MAG: Dihydroorotate dehydrogenase [Marinimicrobia bacterium 46_47]HAE86504.1 dihydroorotate dehydrogenase [Candidatus Neomarinimicrobiota bacterium]HBY18271.1 dihydroorotate dehydrogenase [Candidatus Neomarinimicrobiota bacterium]
MDNQLKTSFLGKTYPSPLVLASGVLGLTADSMKRVLDAGAGAVTTKSFGLEPRKGHPCPAILPFDGGLINAVGLSNPGVDEMVKEIRKLRKQAGSSGIFASVFGRTREEFGEVTRRAVESEPDLIEVNVSCPNVSSEFGTPFGAHERDVEHITRIVKKAAGNIPVSIKLTIHCPSLIRMAKICEENGADAITAINTVGPGMLIDTGVMKPVLANTVGGVSGPAIFPLALKAVYEICGNTRLPVIGTGGVRTADEALQMIMAGACMVSIGSGVYYGDIELFTHINRELCFWMEERDMKNLKAVRGIVHE